jgi:hypothetical protein
VAIASTGDFAMSCVLFTPPILIAALGLTVFCVLAIETGLAEENSLFGRNLIVNGDAEDGPGTLDASADPMPPPGWHVTGNFTAAQYGGGGGLPTFSEAGPPDRGKNLFAGGKDNPLSSAEQDIDVSAASELVDSGTFFPSIQPSSCNRALKLRIGCSSAEARTPMCAIFVASCGKAR